MNIDGKSTQDNVYNLRKKLYTINTWSQEELGNLHSSVRAFLPCAKDK